LLRKPSQTKGVYYSKNTHKKIKAKGFFALWFGKQIGSLREPNYRKKAGDLFSLWEKKSKEAAFLWFA
jgi:hypothetical protein